MTIPSSFIHEFIAASKGEENIMTRGAKQDDALQKRWTDLLKRMHLLDFSQMKALIAELHANDNFAGSYCRSAIASLLHGPCG